SSIYVNKFRVPEYTSATTILLNQANSNTAISSTDVNLNKSLVTTYSEIIRSKRVLRQTIEELNLDKSYGKLYSQISVSSVNDTSIIRISVTDEDAELAAAIANNIAGVFTKEIVDIYKIENISIIDTAEESENPSSASITKIVGVATVAGAFVAAVAIFLMFYFDTTVKNEEDIEKVTGLPVIGLVPISREKVKASQHRKYYKDLAKKHMSDIEAPLLPIEKEIVEVDDEDEDIKRMMSKNQVDIKVTKADTKKSSGDAKKETRKRVAKPVPIEVDEIETQKKPVKIENIEDDFDNTKVLATRTRKKYYDKSNLDE
ncbi:MAG: hypothetical protein K2I70_00240, partial [Bacilli bacterium]|nr:hypothetical protein [Bacilli bacterium]